MSFSDSCLTWRRRFIVTLLSDHFIVRRELNKSRPFFLLSFFPSRIKGEHLMVGWEGICANLERLIELTGSTKKTKTNELAKFKLLTNITSLTAIYPHHIWLFLSL